MEPKPWEAPEVDPDTEEKREKRRKGYKTKYGYLQDIDGLPKIIPEVCDGPIPSDVVASYSVTPLYGVEDPVQVDDDR